jgi:CRISPR-associated protein Cas2
MLVLICYDVNTETNAGQKRLYKVSKQCQNYGQRVQNSVFECIIDGGQLRMLKEDLITIMDIEKDSIRIYHLGDENHNRTEHLGAKKPLDLGGTLVI